MVKKFKTASLILSLILFLSTLIPSSFAAEEKKIAILDFVNEGPYERLNYLKYLLPQILISGLVGQEGIAVLKRHYLEPLIGESELAQKGLLEEKPFTPEEADIIVEGSWAEQPKPGFTFEKTPLLIKVIVREDSSKKILGEVEATGEKDEFARIQKELIAGILSAISGKEPAAEEGREVMSSWEAAEYIGKGLATLESINSYSSSASMANLTRAIANFKRAIYLDPKPSFAYEKIASSYWLMWESSKEEIAKGEGIRGCVDWNGRIIDMFWEDHVICPRAMRQLMSAYAWAFLREIRMDDQFKEGFLKRLQQCVGPFVDKHGCNVTVYGALRLAGSAGMYTCKSWYATNNFQKMGLQYAVQAYHHCIQHCSEIESWDGPEQFRGKFTGLLLPCSTADCLRALNRTEEAIKELEAAIERNPDSEYVPDLHAKASGFAFFRKYKNYELAKKHFALAITSAERLKRNKKQLCWGFAYYLWDKIIDDTSCSDSLRREAFELAERNLDSLRRHAVTYPPAAQKLQKILKDHVRNGDRPFDDPWNLILWTRPKYGTLPKIYASIRRSDVIWLASKLGLWRLNLNTGVVSCYSTWPRATGPSLKITALAESKGKFFIGTTEGLFMIDEKGKWEKFTSEDGLPLVEVNCLAVDQDSCWIGCGNIWKRFHLELKQTKTKALCKYSWVDETWRIYPVPDTPTALLSIEEELWIGMAEEAVCRMDKKSGELHFVYRPKESRYQYVQMFWDEGNSIWCGTTRRCLQISKSTNDLTFENNLRMSDIARDGNHYWLVSGNRLENFKGDLILLDRGTITSRVVSQHDESDRVVHLGRKVYPSEKFIWVVGERVRGLRRETLWMPEDLLQRIAIAYRTEKIDKGLAVEALEKLKKELPKSAGLRLEIADCYRSLTMKAKYGKDTYAATLREDIELHRRKWIEALQEAYELAPKSAIVLDTIKRAEKNENIRVLDEK